MFKKILTLFLAVLMCLGIFTGCNTSSVSSDKISIVCTIFPQYDWCKQIIGNSENVELTLLLDNGTDLHNYQPTADDIIKISECDLFIYVGGESDAWVNDVLKEAVNKDMKVINLMSVMGDNVKEEMLVEGMEGEHEEEAESEEEPEYDEHVWLSLRCASKFCSAITDGLSAIDANNASVYKSNSNKYINELNNLDSEYEKMANSASKDTILVADRFPFRYMCDDYNLTYYAAFVGCSAETEASFETIIFLAGKIDELKLPAVFKIDNSDGRIAKSVIENTTDKNQEILVLNSMQSVTAKDIENGSTYLAIMRNNFDALRTALN